MYKKEQEVNINQTDNEEITKIDKSIEAKWYIIQTYSGYENSVREDLLKLVNKKGLLSDLIFEVICPKEKYYRIKSDGTKQEKEKKMFSGYVFIKMIVNDHSWFVVRNIPKVTGFLGSIKQRNTRPVPISEDEIRPILIKTGIIAKPNYDYLLNKQVQITKGSFAGQRGSVSFINHNQDKIIVEIDLFGRKTPIEVSFSSFKEIV